MNRPKILMVSVRADHGGGPRHIYQLIRNLTRKFEIFIACPQEKPYWNLFREVVGNSNMISLPHRAFSLKNYRELKGFIANHEIKLIHSHGKGAGLYGRLIAKNLNLPSIHTFHGLHINNYNRLQQWIYLNLERWLCAHSKACISVSESERNRILKHKLLPPNSLELIPNGVQPETQKHFFRMEPKVICITRDDPVKNPELLIEIAGLLPNIEFRIIGIETTGKWKHKLIKYKNIKMLGLISEDQLADQFEWASICLNTSLWEGLPISLLEAMSHQVAIVATDVPGNSDLLENSGWKFKSGDSNSGIKAIKKCLSDPIEYESRVKNAYNKLIEDFSESAMCKKTSQLYQNVL